MFYYVIKYRLLPNEQLILMAAINWDGLRKVINTRAVTLSLKLMITYK